MPYEVEIEISERRKLRFESDDLIALRQSIDNGFPEWASDVSNYVVGSLRYDIVGLKRV